MEPFLHAEVSVQHDSRRAPGLEWWPGLRTRDSVTRRQGADASPGHGSAKAAGVSDSCLGSGLCHTGLGKDELAHE